MSKPVIFTISAASSDDEASVWSGHCDDIPAAGRHTPTLDELLAKISAMALDLLPDNHPDIDPASLFLQITALREAEPAAGLNGPAIRPAVAGLCCAPRAARWSAKARAVTKSGTARSRKRNFAVPIGIPSRHTANAILRQAGLPKAFLVCAGLGLVHSAASLIVCDGGVDSSPEKTG